MCAQPQKATLEQKRALIDSVDCFMYVALAASSTLLVVRRSSIVDRRTSLVARVLTSPARIRPITTVVSTAMASSGRATSLIEGVPETLDFLREQGKQLFFVTNNSTKSRAGYLKKFTSLGLNISSEEIYSSSYAAAAYLEATNFPVGQEGLRRRGRGYRGGAGPPQHQPHRRAV